MTESDPFIAPEDRPLAAIDLGSNSFHLIVAKLDHGEIRPMETLAEKVQLAAGFKKGRLADDAIARGLDCLTRFQQLLSSVDPARIRVVGTQALRQAKNRTQFTQAAERILGVPVDVIYGREEARLVYLGVAHTVADDARSRLVIDIGGGSTEFIIGERFEPKQLESLQMGCVSYTDRFFSHGRLSKARFKRAYDQACIEVSHIKRLFPPHRWEEAVGSSGTLQAIEAILADLGLSEAGIQRSSLLKLKRHLLQFDTMEAIQLPSLVDKRRGVIAAGIAIALAIMDVLEIADMRTSAGALREGVIYDLVGRLNHEDVRERSVNAMLNRYSADPIAATFVSQQANFLARACQQVWNLRNEDIDMLRWAALCHDLGATISQKSYRHHSAYFILHADMPGFSQHEQSFMASLVANHRGKLERSLTHQWSGTERTTLKRLLVLLRLAILLKYVDGDETRPTFSAIPSDDSLLLIAAEGWWANHPLTRWEIAQQKPTFKRLGISVSVA